MAPIATSWKVPATIVNTLIQSVKISLLFYSSVARRLPSVAERFGDVDSPHPIAPPKIGDGARDLEDAVITACR